MSETTKIEKVGIEKLDEVWEIVREGSEWLSKEKGLDHWSNWYTRERVKEKIEEWDVYLVYRGDVPVGTMAVSDEKMGYFLQESIHMFAEPKAKALYVSMLGVKLKFQGQGIATDLLKKAEEITKDKGIKYVRFDCRKEDSDAVNFYLKRGYEERGLFSIGENDNYLMLEKKIG